MFRNIRLEMSLKPFYQIDDDYVRRTAERLFRQWHSLIKDADTLSVLLWASDGSEILEYRGQLADEMEWAKYVGGANQREEWNREADPDRKGIHSRRYLYRQHPPRITYGDLRRIVALVREAGQALYPDKIIRLGETFDPGPEFAISDFKYNRHNEICLGESMGRTSMVCCYGVLNEDKQAYAGFPDGIPQHTPFGIFLGRQARIFCADMGFDYIWLSNGFGFGSETWGCVGVIFDGERFHADRLEETRSHILSFWRDFRSECPNLPVETRGTNLSCGIDLASDGVPLESIYRGDFHLLPPPNSPWAALDGDFGLELAGYMSRIAELPAEDYMFRFYLHDPWWANSPWYERYEGQPHDIYMPLAIGRLDSQGQVTRPSHLSILGVDNSYGEMPDACANEPIPHLQRAEKEFSDAPAPLVWLYPFEEYHQARSHDALRSLYFEDWFIRGAINCGLPLSGVISTSSFRALSNAVPLFAQSVLVVPVSQVHGELECSLLSFIDQGGKALFYGNPSQAGEAIRARLNLQRGSAVSGELTVDFPDWDKLDRDGYVRRIHHRELFSDGAIDTELSDAHASCKAIASAEGKALVVSDGQIAWVRGTCTARYEKNAYLLRSDAPQDSFPAEALMRYALDTLGYQIRFQLTDRMAANPLFTVHRYDNGYFFSSFAKDTTSELRLRFPQGAPVLLGYETVLKDGFSTYRLPRAEHRECRFFVEQTSGKLGCKEIPPRAYDYRRRIRLDGLENATVRMYPEQYCKQNAHIILNARDPYYVGDPLTGCWKQEGPFVYYEATGVSGSLMLSFPSRHYFEQEKL